MAPVRARPGASPALLSLVTATVVVVGVWAAVATVGLADAERIQEGARGSGTACHTPAEYDLELTAPSRVGPLELTSTQVRNAEIIVATTERSGRGPEAAAIALAAAMQESALLNVPHGDAAGPDSRGLFQQRLQFYGHLDVMDPATATRAFLDGLDDVDGWEDLPAHQAIQEVQRAAHPERYARWIEPAQEWADALWSPKPICEDATRFETAAP
jgi:hypothetical protein